MTLPISSGTSAVRSTGAGSSPDGITLAANLAVSVSVAAGLASDLRTALKDALNKGTGGMDAISLLRLQGTTAALDVWTDVASAAAKADADKKKGIAGQV